jgi:hypothetical protein
MRTLDEMMGHMGFAPTDTGPNVTNLRKIVARQMSEGMVNRSAGTWAPEHGPAGMNLPAEERARAFLEIEWAMAQGYSCEVKCIDRPFGWRFYFKEDKWRYEIKWSRIPVWLGDRWRSIVLDAKVLGDRLRGKHNPYARS